ncbi:MAG: zonular occludens toxin domain-containing protein, partial [Cloacibacterium sp.]|uniref:zonular occludens toxin domain-containing protein n=1 Tax=Cloacibacterium sp. TaxID=1913682 RepID=UPI003C7108A4
MSDYLVTGRKGTGKSLYCIGVIREALRNNKRVATNLNVHLDELCSPSSKKTITRIPDRPTAQDMEALGRGQDGVIEANNGVIVIDECSTFLGARTWGDKERQPLLDWLIHSRKYGWDIYYIAQGVEQLDKMVRTTLVEYHISVKRTDKWPIPFITPIFRMLGFHVHLPSMSVGTVRYGVGHDALVLRRDWYRSKSLYKAYDTQQVFLDRTHHL